VDVVGLVDGVTRIDDVMLIDVDGCVVIGRGAVARKRRRGGRGAWLAAGGGSGLTPH
jgi:hypothetical protein